MVDTSPQYVWKTVDPLSLLIPSNPVDFAVSYVPFPAHPKYCSITIGRKGFNTIASFYISIVLQEYVNAGSYQLKLMANNFMKQHLNFVKERHCGHYAQLAIFVIKSDQIESVLNVIDEAYLTGFPQKLLAEALVKVKANEIEFKSSTAVEPAKSPDVDPKLLQDKIFGPNNFLLYAQREVPPKKKNNNATQVAARTYKP